MSPVTRGAEIRGGVGSSPERPDARAKVVGEFAYSSDLWAEGMLWGATLRSPHPHARIRSIDIAAALAVPGVRAVLTHEDVPGAKTYGLIVDDQPVLAGDVVRYHGEPIALVAADHPETARDAAQRVKVEYEPLVALTDPELACDPAAPQLHEQGNLTHRIHVKHGDVIAARGEAAVVVTGEYEVGMQDQAFLGPESGLAMPAPDGGVELYVATQWVHADQRQVAASLGLPPEKVRLVLAGVGGAFGGREDLSMQIHASMLALRTGLPVKVVYSREESFFGHVHRHSARLRYEHGAHRDGSLAFVKARVLLDGGAYASTSEAVCMNAAVTAAGPYLWPAADIDTRVVYTNNPPCGAMRGFGAVQVCFAYEAQMDKLAAALEIDPVELRIRNALADGDRLPTGQTAPGPTPVAPLLRKLREAPMPATTAAGGDGLPGGTGNTTRAGDVRRGVGYAIGFKNVGFAGGHEDAAGARVRVVAAGGEPQVEVHSAAAELGQGTVAVQAQVARTELGLESVVVMPATSELPSAGSSSASRQTWFTGGAVRGACIAARTELLARGAVRLGVESSSLRVDGAAIRDADGHHLLDLVELVEDEPVVATYEYRARATEPLDENGQGNANLDFCFCAQRAVVDVDPELGLVRVVEIATAQDVGKVVNRIGLEGQIEGAVAQGLGLALMEEIEVAAGHVVNPSFTDYLIPTILDMPPVRSIVLERPRSDSPYGVTGAAEAPTVSSTAAVVAAVRAATGQALTRVPLRPEAVSGLGP